MHSDAYPQNAFCTAAEYEHSQTRLKLRPRSVAFWRCIRMRVDFQSRLHTYLAEIFWIVLHWKRHWIATLIPETCETTIVLHLEEGNFREHNDLSFYTASCLARIERLVFMEVGGKKVQSLYIVHEFSDYEIKAFETRNTWRLSEFQFEYIKINYVL